MTLPLNEAGTHVHVQHAESGARWDCPIGVLDTYRQLGWEPTEAVEPDLVAQGLKDPVEAPAEPDLFDPSRHNKDEVEAHLAAHAETDPAEVIRVIDLERGGKNRTTITVPEGFDPIVKEN